MLLLAAALVVFLFLDQTPKPMQVLDGQVSVGAKESCAIDEVGEVRCWGDTSKYPVTVGVSGAKTVSADFFSSCAVADERVWCWDFSGLREVAALAGAVDVSGTGSSVCGLFGDGQVRCEGSNIDPEFGASPADSGRGFSGLVDFEVGSTGHGCGIDSDGSVWCWGDPDGPAGPVRPFAKVTQVQDAVQLALKGRTACVVERDGDLTCFGADDEPTEDLPLGVAGVTDAVDVAFGGNGICWIRDTGAVRCAFRPFENTPMNGGVRDVEEISDAIAISGSGNDFSGNSRWCVTERDGGLHCFGGPFRMGDLANTRSTWGYSAITLESVEVVASPPGQLHRTLARFGFAAAGIAAVSAIAWSRTRPHWVHRPRK